MNEQSRVTAGVPTERGAYPLALIFVGVLFLTMTGWYVFALVSDPTTAEWGFFTSNFIYLLGLSQFGVAFSAIMRICGVKWARPYYRIGELATLAFLPLSFAGIFFIYAYGTPYLFHWAEASHDPHPIAWNEITFLLYRNIFAQLLFYIVVVGYFLMGLLPDVTEEDCKSGPGWRNGFYSKLLNLKNKWGDAALRRAAYFYSPVVLVVAVLANTFIAWDFAMMLVDHYHSSIFPMHYIVGNMLAGTGGLLLMALLLSRMLGLGSFFQTAQVHSMSILMTGFTLLWLYMFWAQFFVSWFGNLDSEYGVISLQMYGHYAPYFWTMIAFNFFIPLICLISLSFKKSWARMLTLAVIINIGMWLNRYLIVIPGLVAGHRPFLNLPEVAMSIGLLAGFLFILLLFFKVFPTISNWETESLD